MNDGPLVSGVATHWHLEGCKIVGEEGCLAYWVCVLGCPQADYTELSERLGMRTNGKTKFYCAHCGFDVTYEGDVTFETDQTLCPARDGDFCEGKKRMAKTKPAESVK
jgi:hypothetical protein